MLSIYLQKLSFQSMRVFQLLLVFQWSALTVNKTLTVISFYTKCKTSIKSMVYVIFRPSLSLSHKLVCSRSSIIGTFTESDNKFVVQSVFVMFIQPRGTDINLIYREFVLSGIRIIGGSYYGASTVFYLLKLQYR